MVVYGVLVISIFLNKEIIDFAILPTLYIKGSFMKKDRPIKSTLIYTVILFISIYNAYASNNLPEFVLPSTEYEWKNPLPSAIALNAVWSSSSSNMYAVGSYGVIVHYNGSTMTEIDSGTTNTLYGIWGNSASDIFIVGSSGQILHYNGSTWSSMSVSSTLYAVHGTSGSDVFAVGLNGVVYHYDGSSWSQMTSNTTTTLNSVWANNSNDVFAAGGSGTVMHYNGSTWSAMTTGTTSTLRDIFGTSGSNVYAVGLSNAVIHYNGSTWTTLSGFPTTNYAVWASSSSDVFVTEYNAGSRHYDGSTWSSMNTLGGYDIWGNSSSSVFALKNCCGFVYFYNGSSWSIITQQFEDELLYDVWKSDDNYTFVVGRTGTFLQNNGTTWSSISSGTSNLLASVWGTGSNDLYLTGYNGTIIRYNGSSCSTMTSNTSADLYCVYGTSSSNIFAVGSAGTIQRYNGSTWSSMTSGTTEILKAVWTTGSVAFAAGYNGTILYYNGSTWSSMNSGTTSHFYTIWGLDATHVYAGNYTGYIYKYDGNNWTSVSNDLGSIKSIHGSSENDIYAVSGSSLAHYNGVQWSVVENIGSDFNAIYEKNGIYTMVGTCGAIVDVTTVQTPYEIPDQSINEDTSTEVSFFIYDADNETVSFSGSSSDTSIIPNENITFSLTGNYVTMSITPVENGAGSVSIDVIATDQSGGSSTDTFSMTVSQVNDTPTDINLSSDTICENLPIGTYIGDFSTTDVDISDTYSYVLVPGTGDTDNTSFTISANTLQTAEIFDYETKNSYAIRVRTTDNTGAYYEKALTILITDVNEYFFVLHPSSTQNQTQPISIPLTMNNLSNIDIQSIELAISYDPAVLTATGISLTGTVLENQSYIYDYNTAIPGIIYAGFVSNASQFTGTGLCVYLDFTVIGTSGETSDITISTAIINNQAVSTSDGIFTVALDLPPIFTGILPHTINEDAAFSTSLTITDYETNPCDLSLTITSSNETLVPANTISYTCLSGNYSFAITPVADQNGLVTITIIAEDSTGLTASASFDLTVVSVNDAPVISAITSLTMNEDTSSAFSLTATDIESAGCSLGITWLSSDSSILPDDNISYNCTGDVFQFCLTPVENQFGNVTLSFTITDSGNFTETHALDITVVEINDTPLIGMIEDQTQYVIAPIESLELTATDIETPTCNMGINIMSSNTILLPISNIAFTCISNSFFFTLTPVSEQTGTSTITIVVTDSGGLTASTSFNFNINLPPELSIISDMGTAAGEVSFTFVETDGDTVSLTVTSSDQSLISDANIQIVGSAGNTITLSTTADVEQNVRILLNQESNAHGLATITVEAHATGGTVTETFNVIVSPSGSGNALTFDGDNDFISFGSISGSHPLALAGSQFSMAFWIKPTLTGDSFQRIIDKSTAGLAENGYLLCLNTGNRLKFYLNGMARFTTESNVLTPNMWHHVVVTGDSSQYNCYVNGIAVGLTTENSFELPPNAAANLYIGTWYTETDREFNGQMDEVSIWHIALSEKDVRDYMCKRLTGNETGLLAYFRFDHFTGTTLTDLSGNDYHGTLNNMDSTNWTTSEIPLGDISSYDYTGSIVSDFSVTLSHSDGDAFTAFGDSGSYSGLQIYLVNESPSSYTPPTGFSGLYTDHYFGVFPIGTMPTYSIAYNYSGNTSIASEEGLRLASRSNNAGIWVDSMADLYTSTTTISKMGISAFSGISETEFIPGGNIPPSFGSVFDQSISEDSALSSIPIVVTDTETATCSLGITFNTSQPALLSVADISYTCSADTIYVSLTPVANQSGTVDVVIIASDAAGLASSTTFVLTVTGINDAPTIASRSETSTHAIDFTYTVSQTSSVDLTITSSDLSLIDDSNINIDGTGNNSYSYVTNANTIQTISVAYTPVFNAHGRVMLIVTASSNGDVSTQTYAVIVSPPGAGNALSFDGTDDYINCGNANDLNNAGSITIEAWVRPLYKNTILGIVGKKVDAAANPGYSLLINNYNTDDRKIIFESGNNGLIQTTTGVVEFDKWQHIAVAASGSTATVYLNGVAQTTTGNYYVTSSTNDVLIGSLNNNFFFNGQMDEVRIWNIERSQADIQEYMCKKLDGNETGLVAYYRMDHSTGLTVTDLTGNGHDGSLTDMDNSDWITSAASLGDDSAYDYAGSVVSDFSATIAHADGDRFTATGDGGTYNGIHVYLVNESPNTTTIPVGYRSMDTDHYYGVYPVGIAPTYSIAYNYSGNTFASNDSDLQIAYRTNNAGAWTGFVTTQNTSAMMIVKTGLSAFSGISATEFILGKNAAPIISSIGSQTTDEDIAIDSIAFTATDLESASCGLNIILISSDPTLISDTNLSYICDADHYTITAIPQTNQNGAVTITVIVSDSAGLTISTSFDLTVLSINDTPEISNILDQSTSEDTAINSINFTVTDVENASCSMDITLTSSDESIVPNANLSYVCDNNSYTITAIPLADQNGNVTITVTVSDTGLLTATTSFALTITNISDAPVISSIDDQTTKVSTTTLPIQLTVTDADGDSLTLAALLSDTYLIAVENITFSGTTANKTLTITPVSDVIGSVTITVVASDSQGITASQEFVLTVMPEIDSPVIKLSGGSFQSLMVKKDGTAWAWGYNAQGEIGDGTTIDRHSPIQVSGLTDVVDISGGRFHTMAVKSDGTVWGWGYNTYYNLGDTTTTEQHSPVQATIINSVIAIDSGQHHKIVLKNNGTVWGWGYNDAGQLGDGTTTDKTTSAAQLSGLNNIIAIGAGYGFGLALKEDGTVWSWGVNSVGAIGDGTNTDRLTPVQVSGLTGVVSIACGTSHALALKNDGTVWAWGSNSYGQLGDNTTTDKNLPVQVIGLSDVSAIATQSSHSIALKNDGTVWAWGANGAGQLGDGTLINRSIPVQTTIVTNVEVIGSGPGVTLMMDIYGTVWSCGNNSYGFVGDGTTINRITPVPILSYSANYYPVISQIADQTIDEDTPIDIHFISSDYNDSPCSMTVSLSSSNQSLIPDANLSYVCDANHYTITGIPVADANGTATIDILVENSGALTALRSLALTVTAINDPPVLGTISGQTTNEDTPIQINIAASDADTVDCNGLDVTIVSSNFNLIPDENISYTCGSGSMFISLTPVRDLSGVLSLTITVSDAYHLSAVSIIDLTVTAVNDAPVIGSISDQTTSEDIATSVIGFTVADNETAGCNMTLRMTSSDQTLVPDEYLLAICSGNEYSIVATPAKDQYGTATISVTIVDAGGLAASTSFDLTVHPINDVPTLSSINPKSLNEGTSIDITLTTTDIEGDALSVTVLSSNQSLIQDSDILLANDGMTYTITITPLKSQSGSTNITVSVSDGTDITSMTFLITVNEVYYMIAGHVSLYTDIAGSDLEGVTMTLSGTHSYSMVTDVSGYYTFATVRPGDYTLTASKSDAFNLDIADAVQILKAVVRKISLTCLEQIAADAYIDGRYGAYDAAMIAGYVSGLNSCLNDNCTFWQFVTENITSCETWPLIEFESTRRYTDLTGDATGQDFIGIGCGNVSE
jgi:alpha-tubulin suppressor-like RCC1 family protein